MNVEMNPAKEKIVLALGDPSISGELPVSKVALDALAEALLSHKYVDLYHISVI